MSSDSPPQIPLSCSKRIWTNDEDLKLKVLIDEHGTCSWTKVGESFLERTGKQCRERWYNHLDPSVKKGEWTAEEDMILATMQRTIGNQWAKITKALPGRTDNAIKNRFHATCRAQSRKEAADDDKSTYPGSDGNTDSDSAECTDTVASVSHEVASRPTAVVLQTHFSVLSAPSFKFDHSAPVVFDDGPLLQTVGVDKCSKKAKKVPHTRKYTQDNSTVSEELTISPKAPQPGPWTSPMHLVTVPYAVPQPHAQQMTQYHPVQLAPTFMTVSTVGPSAMGYSSTVPILIPTPMLPSPRHMVTSPLSHHKSTFHSLSLKERLAPGSAIAIASSPTLSDDFKMNIPSASSIDIDENLFDDWMDDGTELGTHSEYTTDLDVPFYQSSYEWGIKGCCTMGTVAASCFAGQVPAALGYNYESSDTLCGFQRLPYGQGAGQPSQQGQKANSTGFFSSLGGRICGAPRLDNSYSIENGHQPHDFAPPQYPTNYGNVNCHTNNDFGNEAYLSTQSNSNQAYH